MEVKINFEVSLSEATLSGLKEIILAATMPSLVGKIDLQEVISQAAQEEKKEQAEPEPVKAPKTPKKEAVKPVDEAEGPAPAEEVSELQLFEAVKAAQKVRGIAPKTVREVFKEFGISASSECPAERRKELLNRINAL